MWSHTERLSCDTLICGRARVADQPNVDRKPNPTGVGLLPTREIEHLHHDAKTISTSCTVLPSPPPTISRRSSHRKKKQTLNHRLPRVAISRGRTPLSPPPTSRCFSWLKKKRTYPPHIPRVVISPIHDNPRHHSTNRPTDFFL